MIPHRTPFFLPLLYPACLVWRVPSTQKELYLTFDDGPVPGPTEFVLDTLQSFNIKATFFCIGDNIAKHPQVFDRIVNAGHSIGNHTFNHLNGWKTTSEQYVANTLKCDSYIKVITTAGGKKLFRPPYGRITRKQISLLKDDFTIVMWDVLSQDYDASLSSEKCLQNTIAATRPGSVVVFHDSFKAEKNLRFALPRYIQDCLDKGYVFKLIDLHGKSSRNGT